jgi:PAS domain S-box-containing protein
MGDEAPRSGKREEPTKAEALRQSEERFRMLADNMSQLAWTCDLLGNVTWYNKRWLDYTGLTFEDMKGWGWGKVQHPDHVDRVVARVKRSSETGEPWEDTFPLRGKDGQYRWFLSRALPMRDEQGNFVQWFGTNTDVTEQVLAEQQVARQAKELSVLNERLQELDRAKTVFFSNVSHEFRTPLTLMLGPLEELKAELGHSASPLSIPQYQQLDLIHRNSLRLLKLTNTLLDFSRIEAGRVQVVYEPTDLAAFTAELASVFRSAIEKAGLKLSVDCPPLSEPAFLDREMWEKIVLNLISNAFKFTFDGEIEVSLRQTATHFELTVRDTGTGIPPEEVPKLFERFHRVAGARGRTHEGSGIGLALVQELARLHSGSVSAESAFGNGSTFKVVIPLGRSHLPAQHIGSERTQASTALGARPFVEEALRWLPDSPRDEVSLDDIGTSEHAEEQDGERPRILIADDNADMRDYVRRLVGARYEVEAVADGESALAAIESRVPDLVLTDIMMPRLDGLGLVARLRADPRTKTLPVILLSARAGEESRIEGLQAGADDYLIKPFSARELVHRIRSAIQLAQVRQQAHEQVREKENLLSSVIEQMPIGVGVIDQEGRFVVKNAQMARFVGPKIPSLDDEAYGRWRGYYPDGQRINRTDYPAQRALRGESDHGKEYCYRNDDGTDTWTRVAAVPLREVNGAIQGAICVVDDIHERKQTEQTQRLLVDELNHRVKNTLANVQAIVQHTLRSTGSPEDFAAGFAGRIQAMSQVHSLLSSTAWKGADLRDLIADRLLLGPVDEARLTAWGPSVHLEPQMAQHLALMLHELGTNSAKYGALSNSKGYVTVGWTVDNGVLRLKWKERDGPPVAAPVRRGFGTTLIEQTTRGEGGDARMAIAAEGLDWEIELPLPLPLARPAKPRAAELIASTTPPKTPRPVNDEPARLAGKRFLVVEDEPLVALDLVAGLKKGGAEVLGPVGTAQDALRLIEVTLLHGALLDANLRGHPVDDIAAALTRRRVPFIFVTGYGRESLPHAFSRVAMLSKPFSVQQLLDAANQLVRQRRQGLQLSD